ncbi:hypothetical protein ISS30_04925 [bacterium]|nr:hypothetical protein [bacterium]
MFLSCMVSTAESRHHNELNPSQRYLKFDFRLWALGSRLKTQDPRKIELYIFMNYKYLQICKR